MLEAMPNLETMVHSRPIDDPAVNQGHCRHEHHELVELVLAEAGGVGSCADALGPYIEPLTQYKYLQSYVRLLGRLVTSSTYPLEAIGSISTNHVPESSNNSLRG